ASRDFFTAPTWKLIEFAGAEDSGLVERSGLGGSGAGSRAGAALSFSTELKKVSSGFSSSGAGFASGFVVAASAVVVLWIFCPCCRPTRMPKMKKIEQSTTIPAKTMSVRLCPFHVVCSSIIPLLHSDVWKSIQGCRPVAGKQWLYSFPYRSPSASADISTEAPPVFLQ